MDYSNYCGGPNLSNMQLMEKDFGKKGFVSGIACFPEESSVSAKETKFRNKKIKMMPNNCLLN